MSAGRSKRRKVLLLSSSQLDDRKLIYTRAVSQLLEQAEVEVWATSRRNRASEGIWSGFVGKSRPFPAIRHFREFPFIWLRKINNAAWDQRLKPAARLGIQRIVRSSKMSFTVRVLRRLGMVCGAMGLNGVLERLVNAICVRYPRSPEATRWLEEDRPDLVVSTCPARWEEPAVVAAAQRLGIPTAVMIHSFDNLTTKDRMLYDFVAYIVWSENMKKELHHLYPITRNKPVYVIGAQQFDVFHQPRFEQTREAFCQGQGLDANRPIVLYALGSPRLFPGEYEAAIELADRLAEPRFEKAQLIVRTHPNFDDTVLHRHFADKPGVVIQSPPQSDKPLADRFQDEGVILEWVNSFRHADVVVNMSSTATIDAALLDTPVVNVDFDPNPKGFNRELIHELNHVWEHFKPIAESDGLWLAKSHDHLAEGVAHYLKHPDEDRAERAAMALFVSGYNDGRCGDRMADAVGEILESLPEQSYS